jgi:hypothetical protein
MASSVAAKLIQDDNLQVKLERGGLGEFSVTVDGDKVVDTNRLWYPSPGKVVEKVRAALRIAGS